MIKKISNCDSELGGKMSREKREGRNGTGRAGSDQVKNKVSQL